VSNKKESKNTGNLVGVTLGDYTLVSKLATGGMAHIYKGVDDRLQRQAAVKVLTPEMMEADETLTERFQREARAVAALEHDNIVSIYQYGEQEGVYFLAMKFVQGMDLADELNRLRRTGQKMEIKRALKILEQVAAALDYAHKAGIVHRDVKPSNILIDSNDKAILTDFGLVLRQSVDQTLGTAFGTPRYISPEQAVASEDAIPQSDIYSLAVILFEILTGQSLFKGSTPMEMALSHIHQAPPPARSINQDIPPAVEAEILKALSKDPKQRHQNATDLIQAVKKGYGMSNASTEEEESRPTKPIGFAPPTHIPESKTPILIEFKEPTPMPVVVEGPIPAPKEDSKKSDKRRKTLESKSISVGTRRRKRRWKAYLASFWLIVVVLGVYLILTITPGGRAVMAFIRQLQGAPTQVAVLATDTVTPQPTTQVPTPTTDSSVGVVTTEAPTNTDTPITPTNTPPSPTNTTAADTPTVPVIPSPTTNPGSTPINTTQDIGNNAILLKYDYEKLSVRNQKSVTLDVSQLRFVRGTDDGNSPESDDFYGAELPGGTLDGGKCLIIILRDRRPAIPDDWNCPSPRVERSRSPARLFWRVDGDYTTFEVRYQDQIVAVCPATTRSSRETECVVNWDIIAEG
jgi:serine/threonine-protein kinase